MCARAFKLQKKMQKTFLAIKLITLFGHKVLQISIFFLVASIDLLLSMKFKFNLNDFVYSSEKKFRPSSV